MHAVQPEHFFLPGACRCFPSFDDALTADIISSVTGRSANVSSARSTFASTFNKPGARLQRYIADIYKGILIIVAAGGSRHRSCVRQQPECMSSCPLGQGLKPPQMC